MEAERVENYIIQVKCPSSFNDTNRPEIFYVECVQVTNEFAVKSL
jgi:hypothetical protein